MNEVHEQIWRGKLTYLHPSRIRRSLNLKNKPPLEESPLKQDLAKLFHDQTLRARYYVFQCAGREVIKNGDNFVLNGYNFSHNSPDIIAQDIKEKVKTNELEEIESRLQQLASIGQRERYQNKHEQDIGNVKIFIDTTKQKNTQVIIYGSFSTESSSSFKGGRRSLNDNIMFLLKGENPTALEKLLKTIDINAKEHQPGTKQNYETIRTIILSIFPKVIMDRVDSNMLREIEVQKVLDLRNK